MKTDLKTVLCSFLSFHLITGMSAIIAAIISLSSCSEGNVKLYNGSSLDGWVAVTADGDAQAFTAEGETIRIAGQPFGYLRTVKKYTDYKAHLEFRWDSDPGTNSGFFHRVQDGDQIWPSAIECQLCVGKLGDFVGLNGARLDGRDSEARFPVKARFSEDSELTAGEWNSIDVEVTGTHIKYFVNGVLSNELDCDYTEGYIAIQSEGGPLCVRNITVREL